MKKLLALSTLLFSFSFLVVSLSLPIVPEMQQKIKVKVNPIPVATMWETISNEFKLNHQENSAEVQSEIRKLLADQKHLKSVLEAAGPYIYFIHTQIEMRGLPSEISLIPVIESEFNPNDHSNKGASGLWQLMPQTAKGLGVIIKPSADGRKNIVNSTLAALTYFKSLGHLFKGDWYLAVAAYNCGEGKILHAEKRSGEKNFWHLKLPKETQVYVPKLLAIAAIIKNPTRYGVTLPAVSNQPFFSIVQFKKTLSLEEISTKTHIDLGILKKLNPDLVHQKGSQSLHSEIIVPIANVKDIKRSLADDIVS